MMNAEAPKGRVASVLKRAATKVYDSGGVVTDVSSYGTNRLSQRMKKWEEFHYRAQVASLYFYSKPTVVSEIDSGLKLDSTVIRHMFRRRKSAETLTEVRRRIGLKQGTDRFKANKRRD